MIFVIKTYGVPTTSVLGTRASSKLHRTLETGARGKLRRILETVAIGLLYRLTFLDVIVLAHNMVFIVFLIIWMSLFFSSIIELSLVKVFEWVKLLCRRVFFINDNVRCLCMFAASHMKVLVFVK